MQEKILNIAGGKISYFMENLGNKYQDGEIVRIVCNEFNINEEFPIEDIPDILEFIIEGKIKEKQEKIKKQLSVRFFNNDIDFIKNYARKKGHSYQSLIRIALKEYNEKLRKNEKLIL